MIGGLAHHVAELGETLGAHVERVAGWWLLAAIAFHVVQAPLRSLGWTWALRAAFPGARIPLRTPLSAHLLGRGMNAVLPSGAGTAAKIVSVKRSIPGGNVPTVVSSLVPLFALDIVVMGGLLGYAFAHGLTTQGGSVASATSSTPGLLAIGAVAVAVPVAGLRFGGARTRLFGWVASIVRRVRQGLAIAGHPVEYARHVALPLLLDHTARVASLYCFLVAFGIGGSVSTAILALAAGAVANIQPFVPRDAGPKQALLAVALAGTAPMGTIAALGVGMPLIVAAVDALSALPAAAVLAADRRRAHHAGAPLAETPHQLVRLPSRLDTASAARAMAGAAGVRLTPHGAHGAEPSRAAA